MTDKPDETEPAAPASDVIVVDPHDVHVQYVDWIVTGGLGPAAGTLNVVLAALDYTVTSGGRPQAIVQSRLRMSTSVAANLHRFLGGILFAPTPPPQSNTLN